MHEGEAILSFFRGSDVYHPSKNIFKTISSEKETLTYSLWVDGLEWWIFLSKYTFPKFGAFIIWRPYANLGGGAICREYKIIRYIVI